MFSTKEVGCFRLLKNKLIRCSNADHIIVMQHELYFHFWFLSERQMWLLTPQLFWLNLNHVNKGIRWQGNACFIENKKKVWGEARCSQWKQEDSINIVFDVTVEICGFRKKAIISWYEWNLVVNYVFLKR